MVGFTVNGVTLLSGTLFVLMTLFFCVCWIEIKTRRWESIILITDEFTKVISVSELSYDTTVWFNIDKHVSVNNEYMLLYTYPHLICLFTYPSWGEPIELFLVPASAPQLV